MTVHGAKRSAMSVTYSQSLGEAAVTRPRHGENLLNANGLPGGDLKTSPPIGAIRPDSGLLPFEQAAIRQGPKLRITRRIDGHAQ